MATIPSGFPTAETTGVPAGTTLKTYNGTLVVTTDNAVIEGLLINGNVRIEADNVTLRNVHIVSGTPYHAIYIPDPYTGFTLVDSEIDGRGNTDNGVLGPGTFLRNDIHGVDNGINTWGSATDPTLIQDNYIHDLKGGSDAHYDGIEINGGSNIRIIHNTIINDHSQTSAVMLDNYFGGLSNITVDGNFLYGGGYTVYLDGRFGGGAVDDASIRITNNQIVEGYWGPFAFYDDHPVQTGNVVNDAPVDGTGGTGGGGSAAVGQVTGLSQDTGIAGDFITNVANQTVSGTYTGTLAAGDVIQVSADGSTWVSAMAGAGTWTAGVTLLPGEHTLSVRTVGDAGNIVNGVGHAYDLDLTGPAAIGQVTGLSQDTGIAGDFITSVANQTVSGTYTGALAGGDVMQVNADGSTWVSATAGAGTWTAGVTLLPGEHTLSVRTVDDAGNIVNGVGHAYDLENGGGGGTDTVLSSVSYSLRGQYIEDLTLTGSDNINGTGNSLANTLVGNSGDNILRGRGGDDVLIGGAGNDVLVGGSGGDQFVFNTALNSATNVDDITDFNVAADTIVLENAIFTTIAGTGTLTAAQFVANTTGTAQAADDHIIYDTDTGNLFFDSNGNAAGGATQFAQLDAGLALTNADFLII